MTNLDDDVYFPEKQRSFKIKTSFLVKLKYGVGAANYTHMQASKQAVVLHANNFGQRRDHHSPEIRR